MDLASPPTDDGEMRVLIERADWAATPLGPRAHWPTSLRTLVGVILRSRFPMLLWWGPQLIHVYNDGYSALLGGKHPSALGRPAVEVWAEIWDVVGPMAEGVLAGGPSIWNEDLLLMMNRRGIVEETYFTFSYSAAPTDDNSIGGVLVTVQETTGRVYGERQLRMLGQLTERCGQARTVVRVCEEAAAVLSGFSADIPFALFCLPNATGELERKASHGLSDASPAQLDQLVLAMGDGGQLERSADLLVDKPLAGLLTGPWADKPSRATVFPLRRPSRLAAFGVVMLGHSARRLPDGYPALLEAVADRISSALANATAHEEEQRRLVALAELDRAKTAFFTNISHEFRTPLTLMLGPIEEALKSRALEGEALELVYRNGRRLLRLVNGLLDFSRIESGRLKAQFEPTDLVKLTHDLVSVFRSAAERFGLNLVVTADPIDAAVLIDAEMFEKIVSNLLSNALKFTQIGAIDVVLRDQGDTVELAVSDTGVGIAKSELPRLFERFHRIEGSWSRTQEGSGIGLALLRDLVLLHGGSVRAESTQGLGTTITVRLPKAAHPAPGNSANEPSKRQNVLGHSNALADEARGWSANVPDEMGYFQNVVGELSFEAPSTARLLVVDDNADMLDYLRRLLGERWRVQTARNGAEALEAIEDSPPDLVVSDVMMPLVDGFELLAKLRANPATRSIPVLLVSARAGEEARLEAIRAGADDYVVKPFGARELVARVEAQLLRRRLRDVEQDQIRRVAEVFEHAPVGVALLKGPEHRFEFANPDYMRLVNNRALIGLSIREAFRDLDGQGIYELLDTVYTTGEPYLGRSVRVMIDDATGVPQERFFDFVYQPTIGSDGLVNGIAVVVYDVSDLTSARRQADSANRAKDDFLAMLGHELRNPLAPIVTTLQIMRMKGGELLKRERGVLERQVDHLVRLVDDLLDVSRIAAGKIELRRSLVDMRDVIGVAVETASPALEQQRHQLLLDVASEPLWVNGDAARLAQVISNLLVNAAKYTLTGGQVSLSASRQGPTIEMIVSDNGIGIGAEMLPILFDLFTQERQALDRAKGGLGLGLTLVKSFTRLHGGDVTVRSDGHGKGSVFKVVLPAAHPGTTVQAPSTPTEAPAQPNRRLLIVDDNVDAAQSLAMALKMIGLEVHTAADGPQALVLSRRIQPEIAVLDIGLPVMDGHELAQALREAQPDIRLIALTGYGGDAERKRSTEGVFELHLVKPVDLNVLLKHLQEAPKCVSGVGSAPTQ